MAAAGIAMIPKGKAARHLRLTFSAAGFVTVPAITLSNLAPGKTYYCVVTAYYSSGRESAPSNEISFTVSK